VIRNRSFYRIIQLTQASKTGRLEFQAQKETFTEQTLSLKKTQRICVIFLVGGFSPTHLKNMRKSNWVHLPQF